MAEEKKHSGKASFCLPNPKSWGLGYYFRLAEERGKA